MKYDEKEVLRYLGYRGRPADGETQRIIEAVYSALLEAVNPKYIYREYDFQKNESSVIIEGIEFKSKKLASHLEGCSKIVLFGATLGRETDALIRRYSLTSPAYAAVAQAVAASLTENLCDLGCGEIRARYAKTTHRFSPGYGGLELKSQTDFFKLLDMQRMLGVSLSKDYMMSPSKTVTAFVGAEEK